MTNNEKHLKKMSGYIERMINNGHSKAKIRKALLDIGWPKEIVDLKLKNIKFTQKKEVEKERLILGDAISDVKKELEKLKIERGKLKSKLKEVGEDIASTKMPESKRGPLRAKKMYKLEIEKDKISRDLEKLKEEMAKAEQIKDDLSE